MTAAALSDKRGRKELARRAARRGRQQMWRDRKAHAVRFQIEALRRERQKEWEAAERRLASQQARKAAGNVSILGRIGAAVRRFLPQRRGA